MAKKILGRPRLSFLLLLLLELKFILFFSLAYFPEKESVIEAPLNQEFVNYLKKPWLPNFSSFSTEGFPLGLRPSPIDVTYLFDRPRTEISGLPSSYDLRSQNKLTPVKRQGSCGSCWAFATYASLESFLLPDETWDFSEQNLIDRHGFDYGPCEGGNINMASAYLTRWEGPVKEEDDPYIYTAAEGFPVRKHVQEVLLIPPRVSSLDNDLIKQAVITSGAVYAAMYYSSSCYNPASRSYYNPDKVEGGHAVAIVGWDDNYDRNKFITPPPGNGAFIVKNSWGSNWGENGYFYVSYYDNFLGRLDFNAVIKAETITKYQIIYQHDPLGWICSLGYSGQNTAWMANIFTAEASLPLVAVSFYVPALLNYYEIYLYTDVAPKQPRSGNLAATKNGSFTSPGYYTVEFDQAVPLRPEQLFSIVVKLTTPGYKYPLPMEEKLAGYSSRASASPGQSFISSNGEKWSDLQKYFPQANVCLKAFAGYPALYPPANFNAERKENNLIFFKEYVNFLSWEANVKNKTQVIKYRLYRKPKGSPDKDFKLLAELGSSIYTYTDRGLKQQDLMTYWITAVDIYNRESEPALVSN
ncbi:MAG: lectin like domain-containing protein [Candidatus Aminicenantales bacterium]